MGNVLLALKDLLNKNTLSRLLRRNKNAVKLLL